MSAEEAEVPIRLISSKGDCFKIMSPRALVPYLDEKKNLSLILGTLRKDQFQPFSENNSIVIHLKELSCTYLCFELVTNRKIYVSVPGRVLPVISDEAALHSLHILLKTLDAQLDGVIPICSLKTVVICVKCSFAGKFYLSVPGALLSSLCDEAALKILLERIKSEGLQPQVGKEFEAIRIEILSFVPLCLNGPNNKKLYIVVAGDHLTALSDECSVNVTLCVKENRVHEAFGRYAAPLSVVFGSEPESILKDTEFCVDHVPHPKNVSNASNDNNFAENVVSQNGLSTTSNASNNEENFSVDLSKFTKGRTWTNSATKAIIALCLEFKSEYENVANHTEFFQKISRFLFVRFNLQYHPASCKTFMEKCRKDFKDEVQRLGTSGEEGPNSKDAWPYFKYMLPLLEGDVGVWPLVTAAAGTSLQVARAVNRLHTPGTDIEFEVPQNSRRSSRDDSVPTPNMAQRKLNALETIAKSFQDGKELKDLMLKRLSKSN